MEILVKRVYEPADANDGRRILVDRLWPRGLSKADARIHLWAKAVSPSNELRRWYGHDPEKWDEFKARYSVELSARPDDFRELLAVVAEGRVTFLYGSKERRLNNARALKAYIEANAQAGNRGRHGL